jgi:N-acetylornithine carbamoyltransferase
LNHFLSPTSLSLDQSRELIALATELRANPLSTRLAGKALGLLFFNPSLRTRSSMDIAMYHLGGHALTLDVGVGTWKLEHREGKVMDGEAAEHIKDAAKVLSRYVDALAIRSFPERVSWGEDRKDPIIESFARWADKPVVNMESSLWHPCQSMADLMTIENRLGSATREPIVITWAWHPKALPMAVPNSILVEAAKFGMDVRLCHPKGWELDDQIMQQARGLASAAGGSVQVYNELDEQVLKGARVVYAKSWGSITNYRNPEEEERLKQPLRSKWRVRMEHMEATDNAFFMHCLPVRRGVIVDDEVLDSDRNAAYDEAENRLHVQKAMLLRLLETR